MGRKKNKVLKNNKEDALDVEDSGPSSTVRFPPKPNLPQKPSSAMKSPSSPPMEPTNIPQQETRPSKRQKTSSSAGLSSASTSHAEEAHAREPTTNAEDDLAKWASTYRLPAELSHLQTRFDFTAMSILSSSKIEQKVRNLITRTQLPDPNATEAREDSETKAGIAVLSAKGNCIAKMVSIVEIAKRAIAAEGAKWYEYCALNGALTNLKEKDQKSKNKKEGGKTLRAWQKEQASDQASNGERKSDAATAGHPLQVTFKDDEEAAFQTMGRREIMAYDQNPKKIRVVPQMTIFVSRVPIPGLKTHFGEQTNA